MTTRTNLPFGRVASWCRAMVCSSCIAALSALFATADAQLIPIKTAPVAKTILLRAPALI